MSDYEEARRAEEQRRRLAALPRPLTDIQARELERRRDVYLASPEGHERVEAGFTVDYSRFLKSPEYQGWRLKSRVAQEEYAIAGEKYSQQFLQPDISKSPQFQDWRLKSRSAQEEYAIAGERYSQQLMEPESKWRPGMGPKPGSPGYGFSKWLSEGLASTESWFEEKAVSLKGLSSGLYEEAAKSKEKGDILGAFFKSSGATFARMGVGAYEAITFPARPVAWGQTAALPVLLAEEKHRKGIWESLSKDISGTFFEGAGAIGGGYLAGYGLSKAVNKFYPKTVETPMVKEFMPLEEEYRVIENWGLEPEETMLLKGTRGGSEAGEGFLESHKYGGGAWPSSGAKGFGKAKGYVQTGHDLIPVTELWEGFEPSTVYRPTRITVPVGPVGPRPMWNFETLTSTVPRMGSLGRLGSLAGLGASLKQISLSKAKQINLRYLQRLRPTPMISAFSEQGSRTRKALAPILSFKSAQIQRASVIAFQKPAPLQDVKQSLRQVQRGVTMQASPDFPGVAMPFRAFKERKLRIDELRFLKPKKPTKRGGLITRETRIYPVQSAKVVWRRLMG